MATQAVSLAISSGVSSGVTSLRHEFPALALAITFIPRQARSLYADLFLLWMEARRATYANEPMISAVRLAWWRDTIINKDSQSVPLAERLIAWGEGHPIALNAITDILNQMISLLAGGAPKQEALAIWHSAIASQIMRLGQNDNDEPEKGSEIIEQASQILHALDQYLLGQRETPIPAFAGKNIILRLIIWLLREPSRLYYPDQQPLLALKMVLAVVFRRV